MMHAEFLSKVSALYQRFQEHDSTQADRIARFRNIEPESAQFLAQLVYIQQPQQILEIGTSTGYSTLWLAYAAQQVDARLTTLEIDGDRSRQAASHLADFNLSNGVEFWVGDAAEYLKQSQASFDFILLDAERDAYVDYWPDLKRLMCVSRGVLVVDNVLSHADQVTDFIARIQQDEQFNLSTLAIGAGLLVVTWDHEKQSG
ncbi:class I SAM-dependent methyltransferase [Acinetobacter johnsonii]|nr:class I SAM-dependent methyltransferase [Acinetobacter johnsonii]QQT94784.1 class I SAM-dependent methyltransferase [Acinetobacter johnsonii]